MPETTELPTKLIGGVELLRPVNAINTEEEEGGGGRRGSGEGRVWKR